MQSHQCESVARKEYTCLGKTGQLQTKAPRNSCDDMFSGDADGAASALQESIQLDRNELQTHLLLATVLEQLHSGPEAATEWRAALAIDPSSKKALDSMAKSLLASRDYPAVVKLLRSTTFGSNYASKA